MSELMNVHLSYVSLLLVYMVLCEHIVCKDSFFNIVISVLCIPSLSLTLSLYLHLYDNLILYHNVLSGLVNYVYPWASASYFYNFPAH